MCSIKYSHKYKLNQSWNNLSIIALFGKACKCHPTILAKECAYIVGAGTRIGPFQLAYILHYLFVNSSNQDAGILPSLLSYKTWK